jgi:hypothetical protein
MRAGFSILIVVLACMATGCIPYHLQQTPRVTGTVVGAGDQTPIPQATFHYKEFPKEIVTASRDGRFDFLPIYRWQMVPLAPYDRFWDLHLIVDAPGYRNAELKAQPGVLDLTNQIIVLERR